MRGDRVMLSKGITLIESNLEEDKKLSSDLLDKIIHATGNSIRIGITGVPGVGKSSFIESFGLHLTGLGKKVAVLTVDPSSHRTKGSILGDKTRMEHLSKSPLAFIRPSPSGNQLGGVTRTTHEVVLLCEAAGHEIIIIETVGVGQSEVSVKNFVDFFVLLMLAGAGDELQGLKKGITDLADAVVITKADGDNVANANRAKAIFQQALHLKPPTESGWVPPVMVTSAQTGKGIEEVWKMISSYRQHTTANGFFEQQRSLQNLEFFESYFSQFMSEDVRRFTGLLAEKKKLKGQVVEQQLSPRQAAQQLMKAYHREIKRSTED